VCDRKILNTFFKGEFDAHSMSTFTFNIEKIWGVFAEYGVDGRQMLTVKLLNLAQTFVSVSAELNHNRSPWVLDSDNDVCCHQSRGETKGGATPRALNHRDAPKSTNNVSSNFFITTRLLLKDLRFKHGGAKLVSCPGRHLTSVRPCTTPFHII